MKRTDSTPKPYPLNRIGQALWAITGKIPPDFVTGCDFRGLTDQQMVKLQDWCASNARFNWMTGIGVMEAAEKLVDSAIENGNILPSGEVRKV